MNRESASYHDRLGIAMQETKGAPNGEWNTNFIKRLFANGLALSSTMPGRDITKYPSDGLPYQAPRPNGNENGWPFKTYVVWSIPTADQPRTEGSTVNDKPPTGDRVFQIQHRLERIEAKLDKLIAALADEEDEGPTVDLEGNALPQARKEHEPL